MLAVTLGVTLLGLQFRSQTYTMTGMMEYMKDKVVYVFIFVFVSGTAGSMIASGHIRSEYDAGWAASFAIMVTVFSLVYHAGYIFHLVYKLQLSQMLKDNNIKMQKSIKRMAKSENSEITNLGKPFEIWEGIMEKAIETDNHAIFKLGIGIIFNLMRKHEYLLIFSIYKEISNYADNVCKSCMYRNRYSFVEIYMDEMLRTYSAILETEDVFNNNLKKSRLYARELMKYKIDELVDIMYGMIDDDEGGTCCRCIEKTMTVVLENIKSPHHHEHAIWMSDCVDGVIKYGILRDSGVPYMLVDMILDESEEKIPEPPRFFISDPAGTNTSVILDRGHLTEWYRSLFRIIKRISIKAADDGEQFSFMNCLVIMMRLCDRYEIAASNLDSQGHTESNVDVDQIDLDLILMFSNFISEVMNILMAQHRYSIVQAFRIKLEQDMHEMVRLGHKGESGRIWRRALWVTFGDIMRRAVHSDDQRTLSFLIVKSRILKSMIKVCDNDEVDVIIDMDFADMGSALQSAAAKHHQGSKDVLIELYLEMGDMLHAEENGQFAKYYRTASSHTEDDIGTVRAMSRLEGRGSGQV